MKKTNALKMKFPYCLINANNLDVNIDCQLKK